MERKKFFNLDVMPLDEIKNYEGYILIASVMGIEDKVEILKGMGVKKERIITL